MALGTFQFVGQSRKISRLIISDIVWDRRESKISNYIAVSGYFLLLLLGIKQ